MSAKSKAVESQAGRVNLGYMELKNRRLYIAYVQPPLTQREFADLYDLDYIPKHVANKQDHDLVFYNVNDFRSHVHFPDYFFKQFMVEEVRQKLGSRVLSSSVKHLGSTL